MSKGPTPSRSVKDVDWCGWNRLEELVEKAQTTSFEHGNQAEKRKRAKGLIITGFKTGARIKEILGVRSDDFSFDGEFWTITLPLVKKFDVTEKKVRKWRCAKCNRRWSERPDNVINLTGNELLLMCKEGGYHEVEEYEGYKTRKKDETRTIEFHSNEPLNDELRDYVHSCRDLLFPHPYDMTKPMKRAYAYTLITEVDDDIWPHWLRAQRACQLADELGFDLENRQDWFKWEGAKYARLYGSKKYELRDKWREPERRIK